MKVSELTGVALDWAVAKCENPALALDTFSSEWERYNCAASIDWAQAGPIIEREAITVSKEDGCWSAYFCDNLFEDDGSEHWQTGPAPLIAAMRCYVASKLGDDVEIPAELK